MDWRSRGLAMVETQHAAETLSAYNAAALGGVVVRRSDELVVEPLVIAFSLIVRDVGLDNPPQVALTERYDLGQTLTAC